jgi:hypothetical protein
LLVRISKQFHQTMAAAKLSSNQQLAVARCIAELGTGPLPKPGDVRVCLPPVVFEWARVVPNTGNGLWLYYAIVDGVARVTRISRNPITRLDP